MLSDRSRCTCAQEWLPLRTNGDVAAAEKLPVDVHLGEGRPGAGEAAVHGFEYRQSAGLVFAQDTDQQAFAHHAEYSFIPLLRASSSRMLTCEGRARARVSDSAPVGVSHLGRAAGTLCCQSPTDSKGTAIELKICTQVLLKPQRGSSLVPFMKRTTCDESAWTTVTESSGDALSTTTTAKPVQRTRACSVRSFRNEPRLVLLHELVDGGPELRTKALACENR